mmetsp:Transcript_35366/g.100122  ORF Transcript_35366/g.100122 Transcript_35366/m.100122 type:complete len:215 (-) Transcript_35366:21-665(-)
MRMSAPARQGETRRGCSSPCRPSPSTLCSCWARACCSILPTASSGHGMCTAAMAAQPEDGADGCSSPAARAPLTTGAQYTNQMPPRPRSSRLLPRQLWPFLSAADNLRAMRGARRGLCQGARDHPHLPWPAPARRGLRRPSLSGSFGPSKGAEQIYQPAASRAALCMAGQDIGHSLRIHSSYLEGKGGGDPPCISPKCWTLLLVEGPLRRLSWR